MTETSAAKVAAKPDRKILATSIEDSKSTVSVALAIFGSAVGLSSDNLRQRKASMVETVIINEECVTLVKPMVNATLNWNLTTSK